jgi:hypothetical protein
LRQQKPISRTIHYGAAKARIARLHRHTDLKIARVIRRARPAWTKPLTLQMKTNCTGLVWNLGKSKHYGAAKARQRRDFPLGQLGRESLKTDSNGNHYRS